MIYDFKEPIHLQLLDARSIGLNDVATWRYKHAPNYWHIVDRARFQVKSMQRVNLKFHF